MKQKSIPFCDQLFTACDGDVFVSTGLPQEVYAKLTVFTNVYLRSVPITRQGPLVRNWNSINQRNSTDRRFLFSQPADAAEEQRVMATQTIGTN
jgi:hypothetical protein